MLWRNHKVQVLVGFERYRSMRFLASTFFEESTFYGQQIQTMKYLLNLWYLIYNGAPGGLIPHRILFRGIWYLVENCFVGSDIPQKYCLVGSHTRLNVLNGVWYSAEIYLEGYDIPQKFVQSAVNIFFLSLVFLGLNIFCTFATPQRPDNRNTFLGSNPPR
jgi:hypothetical protein